MKQIYAIYDKKGEYFNPPFFNHTHGEAERNFDQLVNDKNSNINKYPQDYDLYFIGKYDEKTGTITPEKSPTQVATAFTLKRDS